MNAASRFLPRNTAATDAFDDSRFNRGNLVVRKNTQHGRTSQAITGGQGRGADSMRAGRASLPEVLGSVAQPSLLKFSPLALEPLMVISCTAP